MGSTSCPGVQACHGQCVVCPSGGDEFLEADRQAGRQAEQAVSSGSRGSTASALRVGLTVSGCWALINPDADEEQEAQSLIDGGGGGGWMEDGAGLG